MSIASEISRISGNVADAYTAANAKGATMPVTQNSANLASTISSIPSGGGGGKYQLFDRVTDDSNNDIGCVVGFHTYNNVEYAVVCLNRSFRTNYERALESAMHDVSSLPSYSNNSVFDNDTVSATKSCDELLSAATAGGYSVPAITEARTSSADIEGVTYYGQIPTVREMAMILSNRTRLNNDDPSTSGPNIPNQYAFPTSSQYGLGGYWWYSPRDGGFTITTGNATRGYVIPILEIPNA